MSGILEKYVYSEKELTLKEQAELVDKYLDMMYNLLYSEFPKLKLWTSGSVLHNSFEMAVGDGIKLDLLPSKTIKENLTKCSGCGRDYPEDIIRWNLEGMIRDAKQLVKDKRLNELEGM